RAARQGQGGPGRPAGVALDVELAAEHSDPFADSDETKPTALRSPDQRLLDGEATPVVSVLTFDRLLPAVNRDARVRRLTVLAHVCEPFLHDSVEGDPL